ERLGIALIGCGGMGRRHLRGMAKLAATSHANIDLLAVCDLNQENAWLAADEAHELLGQRPRVYSDVEVMVRELGSELRAASITTDVRAHHTLALACLQLGLHLLCEKPFALTVRGCRLIIEAAQQAN